MKELTNLFIPEMTGLINPSNRGSHQRCSVKNLFLKVTQNLHENICVRVSFLIKLQAKVCNFVKNGDSETDVFLRTLFFTEHLR